MTDMPKREQQREERRQQILEAALAVFTRKGFNAAKVSDVAAQAGVSQGTIYWYFDSKEDLLQGALLFFFENLDQEIASALEQATTAGGRLRALIQSMAALADEAKELHTLFLEFWASSSRRAEASRLWTEMLRQDKDLVVQIIEAGVQSGEFRPVDAEALTWALMAAYDGLAIYLMLMPDLDLERVSRAVTETLLAGLTRE
ncbi:MAG TPA: TetR/AcrR family transcriptional regulator [Anaerolineae bacterium]|nr:TetR/AcrR family transcriptional regulator [Anaerolineae bacterium]